MKAPAQLSTTAEPKQVVVPSGQASARRLPGEEWDGDHDDRMRELLTERVVRPAQPRTAIDRGYGDLVAAAEIKAPARPSPAADPNRGVASPGQAMLRQALGEEPVQAKPALATGYGDLIQAARAPAEVLAPTFGQQARSVDVVLGSSEAARASGMTRDGRVHLRAVSMDASSFEDRFLVGHELAHAIQQDRGAGLSGNTLGRARRDRLEAEADSAGLAMARGLPFQVTGRAPAGAALFRDAQDVVRMTLISSRGLVILHFADGTRESVKLTYNGKLRPGSYTWDADKEMLIGDAGSTPDDKGNALALWPPLNARLSGRIPLTVVQGEGSGHRIQAEPELAVAMPGTKVTYYFATDPELGGRYEYRWWCENDPTEAQRLGKPLIFPGPTTSRWETTWAFPGRHTVVCQVTDKNTNAQERLEFYQKVRTESAVVEDAFDEVKPTEYSHLRARIELQNLELIQGGVRDQSGDGKAPFIQCSGDNPAVPGRAPDYAYNTYTITPSPNAKKFRWSARPQSWDQLPTQNYFGYARVKIGSVDAYNLDRDGPTARFILADARIWTITCEELDDGGQPLGTKAVYRQVIQTGAQADATVKWQAYMKRSDTAMDGIADKTEVALRAAYVNRETGQTMPLQLYFGPSASDPGKVVLVDLLPGVDKVEYGGASIDAALADFETNNSYPSGTIKLEVPASSSGTPTRPRTFETKGQSTWALWSSRVGWTSLGFTLAGVVAAVIPGGQPVAAVLFIAAGAAGAAAGGMSLYDRLQKAERSALGIALDVASVAASMVGAAGAIRALRTGSQALALAGTTGQFLLYSGFATNAVSGLLISVEGIDQLVKILDSPMSRGEKISALVRVLGTLILQGILFALSVRELKQMRTRLGGFLGDELTHKLPPDVLHSLNLLDDGALKMLAGMKAEQLTQVAKMARLNAGLVNRMASLTGVSLGDLITNQRMFDLMVKQPALAAMLAERPAVLASLFKHPDAIDVLERATGQVASKGASTIVAAGQAKPRATALTETERVASEQMQKDASKLAGGSKPMQPGHGWDPSKANTPGYLENYLEGLYTRAEAASNELKGYTEAIAARTGGKAGFRPGPKERSRALDKIKTEYNSDPRYLVDLAGSKIVYQSLDDLYAALKTVKDVMGDKILRMKDRFMGPMESGYRDILMNVKMSNGHVAEFRLHLSQIDAVASMEHTLYQVRRSFGPVADAQKRSLTDLERALMLAIEQETQNKYWEALLKARK